MKKTSWFFLSLIALSLAACGGDENTPDTPVTPDEGTTVVTNDNANSIALHAEYGRLEVPHLAESGSRVIIHYAQGLGVNFMTEWDDARRSQRWSCYVLDRLSLQSNVERYVADAKKGELQYPFDSQLPSGAYFADDPYWGNGYKFDHGHMCPSADRLYSREANIQTFYLTNMQPQFNSFNAGVWANMEAAVRNKARQNNFSFSDTVFVCKGGTIDDGEWGGYKKIYQRLSSGLIVPRYFYMALLRKKGKQYDAIALWISQVGDLSTMSDTHLAKYAISIDELEQRTGIDFFCNLPDNIEKKVEATTKPSLWGLN